MLKIIVKKFLQICAPNPNSLQYWQNRVKKFGRRSVINVDHSGDDFEKIKDRDQKELFPILSGLLSGNERLILDFGCGSGRFTSDLSQLIRGSAVGIDPTRELIELASAQGNVSYHVMKAGEIPLKDDAVDIVWIYAVLGGIKGPMLTKTVASIRRVLKMNGLLFITENTTNAADSKFWTYRDVETIQRIFTFASLKHIHDYFDSGRGFNERFSVLAGRKNY